LHQLAIMIFIANIWHSTEKFVDPSRISLLMNARWISTFPFHTKNEKIIASIRILFKTNFIDPHSTQNDRNHLHSNKNSIKKLTWFAFKWIKSMCIQLKISEEKSSYSHSTVKYISLSIRIPLWIESLFNSHFTKKQIRSRNN